jgi:hypothetical protein
MMKAIWKSTARELLLGSKFTWGADARLYTNYIGRDIASRWHPTIAQSGLYHIMLQTPEIDNPVGLMTFKVFSGNQCIDTILINRTLTGNAWNYISLPLN